MRKPFERTIKKAWIEDLKFHDLRHIFTSHFIMNGGDLMSLRDILGNSNLKMVERYSHLAPFFKKNPVDNAKFIRLNTHNFQNSVEGEI